MAVEARNLAGASGDRGRVKNDYYATPFTTTQAILDVLEIDPHASILEPACGEGHISKVIKDYYPDCKLTSTDLIQREDKFGIGVQGGVDFLNNEFGRYDYVITNPPFSLAEEFIRKAMKVANKQVIMFAKIQLLEGLSRRDLFEEYPPKYVYVFSKRQNPWRNGQELDDKGKPWATTMCFAWYVFEVGYKGEPVIRWL